MSSIKCACGREITVREEQAGTVVRCPCGVELTVPNLRALRQQEEAADADTPAREDVPVVDGDEPGERRYLVFLTDRQTLPQRISFDAASHYVAACDRLIQSFFSLAEHQWDLNLQVAMALLPNGKMLVEIQTQPAILPDRGAGDLERRLEQLPRPRVVGGPVAFAIRGAIHGGGSADFEFDIPFQGLGHHSDTLDQALLEAGGLTSPTARSRWRKGWLGRIRHRLASLFRRFGPSAPLPEPEEDEQPLSGQDLDVVMALESESIEQVEACLERNPHVLSLHHGLGAILLKEGRFKEAVQAYTRLLQLDPDNLAARTARGRAHCLAGSLQQGLVDYTKAVDADPEDVESRAARAMVYVELEAWDAAAADLTSAVELAPIQPHLYVERARVGYAQEKVEQAQCDLQQALRLDPHSSEACVLSGWILQHAPDVTLPDIVNATEYYSRAIEIDPENAMYRIQRAETYASQSKYALAIADCDYALQVTPENPMAYGLRGYAHQQLENMSAAVADCTKAIELGLESAAVHVSRAIAYSAQGEIEQALVDCDAAIDLAPAYAPAFNYRGMLHLGQGDVESATQDFEEASRLAPAWPAPREYRADAHRLQHKFKEAIDEYTDTIELAPNSPTAYVGRALAWMEQREFDSAWQDLTRALQIDEKCVPAYFHRAELSMRREQFDRSLEDLNQVIALDAGFAAAYHARAQMYLQQQRNEDAVRDFSKLIELYPSWPGGYVGRANAWIHLGNARQASEDYREAANLDPGATEELMIHRVIVEAQHLHDQEDYEAAIHKATEAVELDCHSLAALATRAASYWYSEHFVEAVEDYSQLLELDDELPFAYVGRGQAYAELGEYQLALDDLERAVGMEDEADSESGLAYALNGRALALAGLRRFEEAQRDFDESICLRPSNAWVHYYRGLFYTMLEDLPQAARSFRRSLELADPKLTKRKRERAESFLRQHGQEEP